MRTTIRKFVGPDRLNGNNAPDSLRDRKKRIHKENSPLPSSFRDAFESNLSKDRRVANVFPITAEGNGFYLHLGIRLKRSMS